MGLFLIWDCSRFSGFLFGMEHEKRECVGIASRRSGMARQQK